MKILFTLFTDLFRRFPFARPAVEVGTRRDAANPDEMVVVSHNWEINEALVEDRRLFVEAILRSVAVGSPA